MGGGWEVGLMGTVRACLHVKKKNKSKASSKHACVRKRVLSACVHV